MDPSRIYGTGQGMGSSAVMQMDCNYQDLFAACMFVSGEGDPETLHILEDQTFVCFAAEDDAAAWKFMQDMKAKFDADSVPCKYEQWDGTWTEEELNKAAEELFTPAETVYFISFAPGTVSPASTKKNGYRYASCDIANRCKAAFRWLFRQ